MMNNLTNCSRYNLSDGDCEEYGDNLWKYYQIFEYCNYVIVGLGLPGNLAAFITIIYMKPFASSSVYMVIIAFADTMYLLNAFQMTLSYYRRYNFGCKISAFLTNFAMHSSCWTLVTLTLERFIVVWFPLKASNICTKRNALLVNAITTLILIGLNLHFFWSAFENYYPDLGWFCDAGSDYYHFIEKIWYWIDGTVYGFLPWTIIAVLNILIVIGVKMSAKTRKILTQKHDKNNMKNEHQIVVMAFTVSVVFLFLNIPSCVYFANRDWDWYFRDDDKKTYFLVYNSVLILSDFNHAVNFYLYFLSAQKFRATFKGLICTVRKGDTKSLPPSTKDYFQGVTVSVSSRSIEPPAFPKSGQLANIGNSE